LPVPAPIESLWGALGYFYPVVVWMAYVFAGMAVGRLRLDSLRTLGLVGAGGVALAVAGYGTSRLIAGQTQFGHYYTGPGWWKIAEPHSNTTFEVAGNLGVTLAFIAVFCAIAIGARWLLVPLTAVGAMALTAYTGQIIAIWLTRNAAVYSPTVSALLWFVGVTVAACVAWRYAVGRGPLERLLHDASMRVAGPEPERVEAGSGQPR